MMKKILPLFGLFIAGLLVLSSGAFTSVTADRTATISVVGDANALLGLAPGSSSLVHYEDGKLVIDFDNVTATGVNMSATTVVSDAFTVTNNGSQSVWVTLAKTGTNSTAVNFGAIESGILLESGKSATVSFTVTSGTLANGAQILSSIKLTATAEK